MATVVRRVQWVDAAGRGRSSEWRGNPTLAGVQAALANHSNASVTEEFEGALNVSAPAAVAATYQSVYDYAALVFQAADGTMAQLNLPAPKASIFMSDGQTVDPATINDIIVAATAALQTASGATVTNYVSGLRQRSV